MVDPVLKKVVTALDNVRCVLDGIKLTHKEKHSLVGQHLKDLDLEVDELLEILDGGEPDDQ